MLDLPVLSAEAAALRRLDVVHVHAAGRVVGHRLVCELVRVRVRVTVGVRVGVRVRVRVRVGVGDRVSATSTWLAKRPCAP